MTKLERIVGRQLSESLLEQFNDLSLFEKIALNNALKEGKTFDQLPGRLQEAFAKVGSDVVIAAARAGR